MGPETVGSFLKSFYIDTNDNLNISNVAECLGVSRQHVHRLISGKVRCTPAMAARLALATSTQAGFWVSMQASVDLWQARNFLDCVNVKSVLGFK